VTRTLPEYRHVKGDDCVYCGKPATTRDHIPPRAGKLRALQIGLARRRWVTVPACRKCNEALGKLPLWTIAARTRFLVRTGAILGRDLVPAPQQPRAES